MKAELVNLPQNDLGPVNAARVSFDKESELVDGDLVEGDKRLIKYLASHNHWTPFSHNRVTFTTQYSGNGPIIDLGRLTPELSAGLVHKYNASTVRHSLYGWICILKNGLVTNKSFVDYILENLNIMYPHTTKAYSLDRHVRYDITFCDDIRLVFDDEETDPDFIDYTMREDIPIFVARQRFKHMVGFSYNEVSRRYVDDTPVFYTPDVWRSRPEKSVKQGSSDVPANMILEIQETGDSEPYAINLSDWYDMYIEEGAQLYQAMIDPERGNVAPEQARMLLPQSMFTSFYATGSLTAWRRAYTQRIDSHAQKEIRMLAKQWEEQIKGL